MKELRAKIRKDVQEKRKPAKPILENDQNGIRISSEAKLKKREDHANSEIESYSHTSYSYNQRKL
jgi:hypothetical protein